MFEVLLYSIATFFLMEPIVWIIHRYVMHGFLWVLHKDHHQKYPNVGLEKNDLFVLFFASASIISIYFGFEKHNNLFMGFGFGLFLYGIAYFFMHDILSHRRMKFIKTPKNFYFISVIKAHKQHHKHREKDNGECFGFVYLFPIKYYKSSFRN